MENEHVSNSLTEENLEFGIWAGRALNRGGRREGRKKKKGKMRQSSQDVIL